MTILLYCEDEMFLLKTNLIGKVDIIEDNNSATLLTNSTPKITYMIVRTISMMPIARTKVKSLANIHGIELKNCNGKMQR